MRATLRPKPAGLYSPAFEHDACGAGFICNLKGEKSHAIVHQALEILVNLTHRGACGCDARSGDGAGILIQVPHEFLLARCQDEGLQLPPEREYGVGLVFLPGEKTARGRYCELVERVVRAEGQDFLGWRDLPVVSDVLGEVARRAEPRLRMVFIGRGKGMSDEAAFERKLFVIRRVVENAVRSSDLPGKEGFYVPSLSCRTLNYKGMMLTDQVEVYYPDLSDPTLTSGLALVHQRYSTNTFPTWDLAQPFRFLCHNGEINTLRGNVNWMNAREGLFESALFGDDIAKLFPVATPGASDSAILDNALELLYHSGRSLPHAVMMLIPEAWQNHESMSDEKRAFYEYHASLMEPWDGPASIPFSDGICIGAVLDRNGLRPSRYLVTKDGNVIMASETGVVEVDPANIERQGRLEPGRMFLVDTEKGRIVDDDEIKDEMAGRKPYRRWLRDELTALEDLPDAGAGQGVEAEELTRCQQIFGYTREHLEILMAPMARDGKEPTASMGTDTPLAILSERPRILTDYFKQLFAQVTNPPLDAIREELVTSLTTTVGTEQDLFKETPLHCRQLRLSQPIITDAELEKIRRLDQPGLRAVTLPALYPVEAGGAGLEIAVDELCAKAAAAIEAGSTLIIISDRWANGEMAPIPAVLACAGVHHHLIRKRLRTRCGLILESGEPREVHNYCVLLGYGVGAVNPYLALATLADMTGPDSEAGADVGTAVANYVEAVNAGLLKVMSKMGISTLHSYRGAQIFEAVGIGSYVIDKYFSGTASRVEGLGMAEMAEEVRRRHARAFPRRSIAGVPELEAGGDYKWRRDGEAHLLDPIAIGRLQQAVRTDSFECFEEFARAINDSQRQARTLRGLLDFKGDGNEVPLEEVEPWTAIVQRFKSGAMSYGSLSKEAHETLAIAMNRIGGKSNSGEGGEDADRYERDANGDLRRSAIKQVASGRFGVTSNYLWNASELQIKMAQGAKPGEGGQLPSFKVYPWIAKTRYSTPYVQLISPPPHHDIYSIEDLAQLIHDLKNANTEARINVKLVSEVGVGTVAAGVSKGKADVVLISGYDGGTGASPASSIRHAGLPWELGLAEAHQTLVMNDLRSRITVECDGKLLTGRDVAIACLLGAEEFGFATGPLMSMGCVMMRVCHLNTCPVGVATQDPELRAKFAGKPEHVVNFLRFVAEDLRRIMARLGFRTIDEMVGRADRLAAREAVDHWKARGLDFSNILLCPDAPPEVGRRKMTEQEHGLEQALDHDLIKQAQPALQDGEKVKIDLKIRNINRTVGTMLSSQISRFHGEAGLPEDTIEINCRGSAGQSFCAFGARGLTMIVAGDANDYFGKGLSGAKLSIAPPPAATFVPEENTLIGNVAFYGATAGKAFVRGLAGERFCVRNSGVHTVVEGVGDHGCEYMTGGRAVILGPTGRNFAAGMSGGIAYVLDVAGDFGSQRCNQELVDLEEVTQPEDVEELRQLIEEHGQSTGSTVARRVLDNWDAVLPQFVKVMPRDYKRALAAEAAKQSEGPGS